ncbi:MAG: TRAP transporter small permease subunit [Proteobacteria bacterium]|nr:TRAP transporter small permease subunit [Pseudomonadota bacterium]
MNMADSQTEASRVIRGWHFIVEAFAAIGTVLIGVLMLIICADIAARNLMGASLPLVSEGGALLVVTLVALQLAATVRAGRLARTEFVLDVVKTRAPRAAAFMQAAFNAIGAAILGTIAWASIRVLEKDLNAAEYIGITGMATLPTWPFRALILAGFAIAAIEFVVATLGAIRAVAKAGR